MTEILDGDGTKLEITEIDAMPIVRSKWEKLHTIVLSMTPDSKPYSVICPCMEYALKARSSISAMYNKMRINGDINKAWSVQTLVQPTPDSEWGEYTLSFRIMKRKRPWSRLEL